MEGCHVIIFISQNPNPNFLLSFHHHGSRRRTSSPRRSPLHHHHTIAGDAPAATAPPQQHCAISVITADLHNSVKLVLAQPWQQLHTTTAEPPHLHLLASASAATTRTLHHPHAAAMETATAKQTGASTADRTR
ncbi:hypothetical protein DEO72_LG7g998 [Vigna unguiculata]|uniref:Uncharacterized protein n=1 Tax=Vigna unguiculata TaxID=3917 RepID=A0A4D6MFY8_VIGUN|nr:hypothetical protein DEO72_LG7g998 [Vigna unguiculata]